jgi:hypothetical protein
MPGAHIHAIRETVGTARSPVWPMDCKWLPWSLRIAKFDLEMVRRKA